MYCGTNNSKLELVPLSRRSIWLADTDLLAVDVSEPLPAQSNC